MTITPLHQIIAYEDKHTLVKALIYLKLAEKNIRIPESHLSVLSLFSMYKDTPTVIQEALDKGYTRSWQTGENMISRLVQLGLLSKGDAKIRKINPDIFPEVPYPDHIAAVYKIHNINPLSN